MSVLVAREDLQQLFGIFSMTPCKTTRIILFLHLNIDRLTDGEMRDRRVCVNRPYSH